MGLRGEVLKERVKGLYQKLSKSISQNPEVFHYNYFEIREGGLYYENMNRSLTTKDGILRSAGEIAVILGKNRLRNIPKGKVTDRQAVLLNRVEKELPSMSDVANVDDIKLQEVTENISRSTENLIQQLKGESSENVPMQELLGLDKQLRSIWGSLRVEVAKKILLKERIEKEKPKLEEI